MSTSKVTLGGVHYDVPKMNIGQLEDVTVAFELPPSRRPFAILKIALRRAKPKIENVDEIEADNDEIAAAVSAVLANSGFRPKKDGDDPNRTAPESGAAS